MYVSDLDRPWLDTPFLMQGFVIADAHDARVVAQYCEHVWIDDHRGKCANAPNDDFGAAPAGDSQLLEYDVPVEEEHHRVSEYFKSARFFASEMQDDVRLGGAIDTDAVQDTVEECVSSVLRNPDALLWMSKIRQESAYTAEHSLNVCILAVAFGRHLDMPHGDLETLGLCGLLHDIGKMRVPAHILEKPARLTENEMKLMKAHTVHGRNMLLSTPRIDPLVVDAAYSHHEHVDGNGYPRKISSSNTSRFAQIISIVDAYDAMTANRCYSSAISTTQALKIVYQARGKQFNDELSLQFIKLIGLFPVGSVVSLYSGEVGIVVETNPRRRHLPRVVVVLDRHQNKKERYEIIDLLHIEEGDLSKDYLIKQVLPDGSHGVFLRQYQDEGILLKF